MANENVVQAIDSAAKNGKFGDNYKLVDLIPSNVHGEDHFASAVVFAEVKLQNGTSEKSVNVVIKQQQKDVFIREMMNTDVQFYNEVFMYNELLPSLEKNGIVSRVFPKCFYGRATLGEHYEDDLVVVEDLRQAGYKLSDAKIFLDFDHCALVLKTLAKFHALSYARKQDNPEEFYKLVGKLKEVRYEDKYREDINKFWGLTLYRGVTPLEEESGEYEAALGKIKSRFLEPFNMMKTLCQPEEPVAVICHGDFCRNNMVFRYDGNNKPVGVRFFDVATARYASPAIDLAFFLLMNTTTELRKDHWDELLRIYHESLTTAVTPKCNTPSLDVIKQEVATKAVYGYTHCSFFIPMMMDENKQEIDDFSTMKPEEVEALTKFRGGDEATKIVTDIVRDLVRLKCV